MSPPTQLLPGPELPLLSYYCELPTRELQPHQIEASLHRAIVRCYAIELLPMQVLSVSGWNDSLLEEHRYVVLAFESRFNPNVHCFTMRVNKNLPVFDIKGDQLNDHRVYKSLMRIISLGFKTPKKTFLERKLFAAKAPDLTRRFDQPLPGAVVEVADKIGWVVRQTGADTVVVEDERLLEDTYHFSELTVLG